MQCILVQLLSANDSKQGKPKREFMPQSLTRIMICCSATLCSNYRIKTDLGSCKKKIRSCAIPSCAKSLRVASNCCELLQVSLGHCGKARLQPKDLRSTLSSKSLRGSAQEGNYDPRTNAFPACTSKQDMKFGGVPICPTAVKRGLCSTLQVLFRCDTCHKTCCCFFAPHVAGEITFFSSVCHEAARSTSQRRN